jgi:hypothetical protein
MPGLTHTERDRLYLERTRAEREVMIAIAPRYPAAARMVKVIDRAFRMRNSRKGKALQTRSKRETIDLCRLAGDYRICLREVMDELAGEIPPAARFVTIMDQIENEALRQSEILAKGPDQVRVFAGAKSEAVEISQLADDYNNCWREVMGVLAREIPAAARFVKIMDQIYVEAEGADHVGALARSGDLNQTEAQIS